MRFGITPREWGDFLDEAVRVAKFAESMGFDSVFIEEHHQNPDYLPSPLMSIAAISQHVPNLFVGSDVSILPLYHPIRFAEDITILTQVTKGKVILGVAAGYRDADFNLFGVSLNDRALLMDESLALLRKVLTEEKVTFKGKFCSVENYEMQPRPYKGVVPPIWVGGWKRQPIARAARLGDYWFPGPVGSTNDVLKGLEMYKKELSILGKKFRGFPLMRDLYLSTTKDKAISEVKEAVLHKYGEDYSSSAHPLVGGKGGSIEEWLSDRFIVGSGSDAIEMISRFQKEGCFHVVLRAAMPFLKEDDVKNSVRIFGESVIPYYKNM